MANKKGFGVPNLLGMLGVNNQPYTTKPAKFAGYDAHVTEKPTTGRGRMGRFDKSVLSPADQQRVDLYHATKGKMGK